MAFLQDDDKLLGNEENQGQQGQGQSPMIGSSSADVGTGVSTAGIGAGGQGGWTNIQAYLNANKDNNNTANAIKNQVGSKLSADQSKIQSEASEARQAAQSQVGPNYSNEDLASALNQYTSNVRDPEARDALAQQYADYFNAQYQGPQSFSTGISGDSLNYGNLLQPDNFDALLNNVYNQAAGGRISAGQKALQHQLDVNNPALPQTRQSLLAQYEALQNLANEANTGVNADIDAAKTAFSENRSRGRSFLESEADTAKSWLDNYYYHNPEGSGGTAPGGTPKLDQDPTDMLNRYNAIQKFLGRNDIYGAPHTPTPNTEGSSKDDDLVGETTPKKSLK